MERVGIRELRNNVAAVVRRAAGGERIVITVDGVATAQIGPLEPDGSVSLDDLIATGLVLPPGRSDRPPVEPGAVEDVPVDATGPDGILDDLRGGR
jgi:prevent-host-death family protein